MAKGVLINHTLSSNYDIVIIGAGIVGLATAKKLSEYSKQKILVVEAEPKIAQHQTGNNSGVIHAGLYYKPGSLKAKNCVEGRKLMIDYCENKGIPFDKCGKVVVATEESELKALSTLKERSLANGLTECKELNSEEIKEHEPHCIGIAGLYVPDTCIVDYKIVAENYKNDIQESDVNIILNSRVIAIEEGANEINIEFEQHNTIKTKHIINCAGLHSDHITKMCGLKHDTMIIPFRGEYYEIIKSKRHLVNNLIYPVPNPEFPFLGVHYTRRIDHSIEAGPNAVLAFKREGYKKTDFSFSDMTEVLTFPGFWKMATKYWSVGLNEMKRSYSKIAFTESLQKLIPSIQDSDIVSAGAGIRAQAVDRSGKLLDDFKIIESKNMIHVLNAPSPAATASLSIGKHIAQRASKLFNFPLINS